MRKIKFRVWGISAKQWYNAQSLETDNLNGIHPFGISPKSVVVQQFTGLKDKDGKDIYEGDILADPIGQDDGEFALPFIVVFRNGCFAANYTNGEPAYDTLAEMDIRDDKIDGYCLGNIFENPELLNV